MTAGFDMVDLSKRLGYNRPAFTLEVYCHDRPETHRAMADRLEERYRRAVGEE
jgi:hypothetical protein